MHPPLHICRKVAQIAPNYRIGWAGSLPEEDELNPGAFVLVALRDKQEIGSVEESRKVLSGQWDVIPVHDEFEAFRGFRRYERGPLFNVKGGTRPDWDPNTVRPIIVQSFDEGLDFTPRDIFSGRFLIVVRMHAARQVYKMRRAHALQMGRDAESHMAGLAKEMGEYLWSEALKADQSGLDMAYKHAKVDLGRGSRWHRFKEGDGYDKTNQFLKKMGYDE